MEVEIVDLFEKDRFNTESSSKGNQVKWYYDGVYYKANTVLCYESYAEYLVSVLLDYTEVSYDYVNYNLCIISETDSDYSKYSEYFGCYSKEFCNPILQSQYSFYRLLKLANVKFENRNRDKDFMLFICSELEQITGINPIDYLGFILVLDNIILNDDRHLNNLVYIFDIEKECFKLAPIFDNGSSLLSDCMLYPMTRSLKDNIETVKFKPFCNNQLEFFNVKPLKIKGGIYSKLNMLRSEFNDDCWNRALDCLEYRLHETEGLLWTKI